MIRGVKRSVEELRGVAKSDEQNEVVWRDIKEYEERF